MFGGGNPATTQNNRTPSSQDNCGISGDRSPHATYNMNYRLCDYNPNTAAPDSSNGCGAHTDYGTFSITEGVEEVEDLGQAIRIQGLT
jgi:hypothetical protein